MCYPTSKTREKPAAIIQGDEKRCSPSRRGHPSLVLLDTICRSSIHRSPAWKNASHFAYVAGIAWALRSTIFFWYLPDGMSNLFEGGDQVTHGRRCRDMTSPWSIPRTCLQIEHIQNQPTSTCLLQTASPQSRQLLDSSLRKHPASDLIINMMISTELKHAAGISQTHGAHAVIDIVFNP
jgi:hypothetical protein